MTVQRGEGAPSKREKRDLWGGEESVNPAFGTPDGTGGVLIASPVVTVSRLVYLQLLLNGGVLAALSRASLSILLQVVVEHLGMGLLMGGQDVHVGSRSVTRRGRRIAPECRGQTEGSAGGSCVETLLLERLCLCVNRP